MGGLILFGKDRERHFPDAWIQAGLNAVAHADYAQRGGPIRLSVFDDRLGVENPGFLPFGLTIEDLPRGVSKLRNRGIGRRLVREIDTGPQDPRCRYFLAERAPA